MHSERTVFLTFSHCPKLSPYYPLVQEWEHCSKCSQMGHVSMEKKKKEGKMWFAELYQKALCGARANDLGNQI